MNMIIVWFYFINMSRMKSKIFCTKHIYTPTRTFVAFEQGRLHLVPRLIWLGASIWTAASIFEKIIRTYYHNYLKCCICNHERSWVLKPHLGKVLGWSGWRKRRRRVGWLWRLALCLPSFGAVGRWWSS